MSASQYLLSPEPKAQRFRGLAEIMDIINEAETRFPVDEWKSNGFYLWPLIRMDLAWSLNSQKTGSLTPPEFRWMSTLKSVASSLIAWGLVYCRDYKHNAFPARKTDVFFWSYAVSRQAIIEGRHYNIFCDPLISLIEEMGLSWVMWETGARNEYRIPRFRPSCFTQPHLFWNRLFFQCSGAGDRVEIDKLEGFREFTDFVRERSIHHFRYLNKDVFDRDVRYLRMLADSFRKCLKTIRPSLIVTDNYGIFDYALNAAASELGIPTVNLQHGVEGELHFMYGRFLRVPRKGYELLPRIFWCWDETSKNAINDWVTGSGTEGHQAVLGGNPWLELWRSGTSELVREYDRKIQEVLLQKGARRHILLTLQPPVKIYYENELVSEFVLKAITQSPADWYWWIRLHPDMSTYRESIRKLFFQYRSVNVEFDFASSFPLPALLRYVDVHATHSSSTVLEAKAFGVPSVVWSEWGRELFSGECQNGFVVSAFSSSEFLRAIEKQFEFKKKFQPEPAGAPRAVLKSLIEQVRSIAPAQAGL